MPTAAPKLCPHCPRHQPCPEHSAKPWAKRSGKTSGRGGRPWRRIRQAVLDEEPLCSVCGRRPAEEVDHITPVERGGTDDRANLQGVCGDCHDVKTQREAHGGDQSAPEIILVTGPPAAGKSTYVRRHHRAGELVLDLDEIFAAVSLLDPHAPKGGLLRCAIGMRRWAAKWVAEQSASTIRRAWLLSTAATEVERRRAVPVQYLGIGLVVLETPAEICVGRIQTEGRTDWGRWQHLITDWWDRYEPPAYGERWRRVKGATG